MKFKPPKPLTSRSLAFGNNPTLGLIHVFGATEVSYQVGFGNNLCPIFREGLWGRVVDELEVSFPKRYVDSEGGYRAILKH